ncbi:MAG: helicase-exonuclease AddAB subunit AddA, partial [Candidatus Scatovivens sp.]
EKILDALYKKIEESPNDLNLQKQIILLKKANICTIHSFCLSIIKNNFFEIDLTSNFRISTEEEIELLKQECLEDLFDKYYEIEDKEFNNLLDIYTGYKDDIKLKDLILKIYSFIQSMPFPMEWLEENILKFNQDIEKDFSETVWGKILLEDFFENLEYVITTLKQAKKILDVHIELGKYSEIIQNDLNSLKQIKYSKDNKWDELLKKIENLNFERWITDRKIINSAKDEAKQLRDIAKKRIEDIKNKTFLFTSKESLEDISKMYPIFESLKKVIYEFDLELKKIKKEKNIIDFNDIEHYALNILVKKIDGKYVPTDVAKRYIEKFDEIAIDEYQDSNQVQEYILSTISNGNNMFMVGDVKQSIYKFRQACPELFLDKYNKFGIQNKNEFGLKIPLFKNFRSRENIINIVNIIFETIMSNQLGDNVNYTEKEFLNKGAEYEQLDDKSEICIIDLNENESSDNLQKTEDEKFLDKEEIEAKFVANKIEELIKSKTKVTDKYTKKLRNIEYKDIVILLRSTSNLSPIYEMELLNKNIPVYSESSSKYLDTIEIQSIMNLLKIIDNPINDIALVSVLRGPIYSFSDNEILEIRVNDREKNFYYNLLNIKNINLSTNLVQKVENFIADIEEFRKYSKYLSISELIWKIYIKTGFLNYVLFMPNGSLRQANLKMLFERAKEFEKSSYRGLYNFIKFIENLKNNNKDLTSAKIIGENENVVRIMSIHKSKGLEFPYVFLSSTSKKINLKDLNDLILLHQKIGLGPEFIDNKRKIQYSTAPKLAMQLKIKEESIAEEMRILYVALTRAKDKLIITGTVNNYEKELQRKREDLNIYNNDLKINKLLLKKYISYFDWIHLVYLKNDKLKKEVELKVYNKGSIKPEDTDNNIKTIIRRLDVDVDTEKLEKIINWKYKFMKSTLIPIKTSVSNLKDNNFNVELFNNEEIDINKLIPEFVENEKTSATRVGTIIHNVLQSIDFKKEYNINLLTNLINNLVMTNQIRKEEVKFIDKNKILKFLNSNLGRQIKNANKVYKEVPFCTKINAKKYFDASDDEYILVQGIIDLYFIDNNENIIIVDYKTDFEFNEENLKNKYKNQLELYAIALEKNFNKKIYKKYLYSLFLNKEIEI